MRHWAMITILLSPTVMAGQWFNFSNAEEPIKPNIRWKILDCSEELE